MEPGNAATHKQTDKQKRGNDMHMTIDEFNAWAQLIEMDDPMTKLPKYKYEVEFVEQLLSQGYVLQICAGHGVQMEEYEPGMIRCPKCYEGSK